MIADISDRSNPTILGKLTLLSLITDITINNDYTYVVYVSELQIIDSSDPTVPNEPSHFDTGSAYKVTVSGDYAYVADGKDGLDIIRNDAATPIENSPDTKNEFILNQNYPNPFNPTTTINYTLPKESKVKISVYNIKGQLIETLTNTEKIAGYHTIKWNGSDWPSGTYFYRIKAGDYSEVRKCILLK